MLSGSDMNTGADVKGGMTTLRKGQGRGDAAPSKGGETTQRRVRGIRISDKGTETVLTVW